MALKKNTEPGAEKKKAVAPADASGKSVEEIVDEIEKEEKPEISSLSVDEDGNSEEYPLLAGYEDEDGKTYDTFTFREMNGKDEEAINKSDIRMNGAKVMNVLVERCVTSIGGLTRKSVGAVKWKKIIESLLGGDIDWMVMKIRAASKGNEIEFRHTCPHCKAKLTSFVDVDEFGTVEFKGLREIPFNLVRGYKDKKGAVHKDGVIRLMNAKDREVVTPMIRKNPAQALTAILSRTCVFDDGFPVDAEVMSSLSVRDRDILNDLLKENTFGIDTTIELTCSSCGEDITSEVQTSNFL